MTIMMTISKTLIISTKTNPLNYLNSITNLSINPKINQITNINNNITMISKTIITANWTNPNTKITPHNRISIKSKNHPAHPTLKLSSNQNKTLTKNSPSQQ